MSGSVTIVDYGVGNILSVTRAFQKFCNNVVVTSQAQEVLAAERLVIPGVGAFPEGMRSLQNLGLVEPIRSFAASGKPLLGICLGMQLLFDFGEEFEHCDGLGLIPGGIVPIPKTTIAEIPHKIPHIGWNYLKVGPGHECWNDSVLSDIPAGKSVYFVHSFMAAPANASHCLAVTDYNGRQIPAVVKANNIFGCQFHPEKSGTTGLKIIEAFLNYH